jgi:hypothetical protein
VAIYYIEAYRRNRLRSILNGNDLSFHSPDTLPPGKETPGTHSVSGWVDPRAGPVFRGRQKYLVLAQNGTPDHPARNLVNISTTSSQLLCYRVKMLFRLNEDLHGVSRIWNHHHHHHHWHNSPFWAKAFLRSFCQLSLFLAAFLQFLSLNFLASCITPSSHLSFGLPLCLLPSTTAVRTLLVGLCSSSRITCPAHLSQLIYIYVSISFSLYNVYNSSLSRIWNTFKKFVYEFRRSNETYILYVTFPLVGLCVF